MRKMSLLGESSVQDKMAVKDRPEGVGDGSSMSSPFDQYGIDAGYGSGTEVAGSLRSLGSRLNTLGV